MFRDRTCRTCKQAHFDRPVNTERGGEIGRLSALELISYRTTHEPERIQAWLSFIQGDCWTLEKVVSVLTRKTQNLL